MLSTKAIKNASQASHYFTAQDNYYTKEEGLQKSEWYGKGATLLNLNGGIDTDQFNALLEGRLPNGQQLGKHVDGEIKHRAGWDLTFSAPKSVSILALLCGDKRLIDVHRQAVLVALTEIERGCSQARVRTEKEMTYQNTQNMITSLFHHDLSRALDTQLHTHCVVFNVTQRLDGQWRSQASQLGDYSESALGSINGFIERVRHHKRYYGQLYRNELAYHIKQLGYDITSDKQLGLFEIVGVPQEVLQAFSQRRNDIERYLKEHHLTGSKATDVATLETRDKKISVDRAILFSEWQKRLDSLNITPEILKTECVQHIHNKTILSEKEMEENILITLQKIVHDMSVFKPTFTLEEIIVEASDYMIQNSIKTDALLTGLKTLTARGDLIDVSQNNIKTNYLAKTTLATEQQLVRILKEQNTIPTIINKNHVDSFLCQHNELTLFQKKQLQSVFGNDRMIIIEGEVARDALSIPILQLAKASRLSITVLSPTSVGSKRLWQTLNPTPTTWWEKFKALWQEETLHFNSVLPFLSHYSSNANPHNAPHLVIVDRAHLLPTQQMLQLAQWSVRLDVKLVLVGDQQKLLPQRVGAPFHQLIEEGAKVIQHNVPNAEKTLLNAYFKDDLHKILNKVIAVKQEDERYYSIANHFARLSFLERQKAWIVSSNKISCDQLNFLTHKILLEKKLLGESHSLLVLLPLYLPEGKYLQAGSYLPHRWVRFNNQEYYRVIRSDKKSNQVWLERSTGKQIIWKPHQLNSQSGRIELFVQQKRSISIGEQIVFHRSIAEKKIVKGERLQVRAIRNGILTLINDQNKSIHLDLRKKHHTHFDYGYASNLHAISHEKSSTILAHLPSKAYSMHQRAINQLFSQSKQCWIYTDDISTWCNQLETKTGDKLTAQAILQQHQRVHDDVTQLHTIIEKTVGKSLQETSSQSLNCAIEALEYAIAHLAEREAGFTHKQILEVALQHALGEVNLAALTQAVQVAKEAGILLKGQHSEGTLWTTLHAVKIERAILQLAKRNKGCLSPLASDEILHKYCDPQYLNEEQIQAVKRITQSRDRILAIQGYAGTGKTTLLQTAQSVLKEYNFQMLGLAPTHTAVNELKSRGIPSQTLDSFLANLSNAWPDKNTQYEKTLLVLDEASLVSNRKMIQLLEHVHQLNSRLIVVGDVRQLPAIEAGKPQSLLQTQVETIPLTAIKRQRDALLKQVVKETIHHDFKAAFKILENSIIEINGNTMSSATADTHTSNSARIERLQQLVDDYFHYSKEYRENILIITPGHDDRQIVNTVIRERLQNNGILRGSSLSANILIPHSMTTVERSHPANYSVGDVLRFGKSSGPLFKGGDYATVTDIHAEHRLLTLLKEDGQTVSWQIPLYQTGQSSPVEIFKSETRELQAGDSIRWTRSDKAQRLLSAELAVIKTIDQNVVTVQLANQTLLLLDTTKHSCQHWDHGYASTVYAAQGKTKSVVLAHLESFRKNLMTQPAFLVSLTRAVDTFRIYTDDKKQLLSRILKNPGIKRSSLEVIGEYPASSHKDVSKPHQLATKTGIKKTTIDALTARQIRQRLNENAESLATALLGKPVVRTSQYLRFGSHKGSLIVTIQGTKQGLWYDFSPTSVTKEKAGGDMLKLLQTVKNLNTRQALQEAAEWLRLPLEKVSIVNKQQPKQPSIRQSTLTDQQKKSITFAKKLARQSRPLKGTLGEHYLQQHRSIYLNRYSKDVRFHPGIYSAINNKILPALLVVARDKADSIQAVQAIYLDEKTAQKISSPGTIAKQTFGVLKGALVTVQSSKSSFTLIAEGPETGLSLAQAIPEATVKVTLGKANFLTIEPQAVSEKIIFCLDNDGKNHPQDTLVLTAIKRLKEVGKLVAHMLPQTLEDTKKDYNDVLKQQGVLPIKGDYKKVLSHAQWVKPQGETSIQKLPETGTKNSSLNPSPTLSYPTRETLNPSRLEQVKVIPPRQKEQEIEL